MIFSTIFAVASFVAPARSCPGPAPAPSPIYIDIGTYDYSGSWRRRLDGRDYTVEFEDVAVHDPLCEWILNDVIDNDWSQITEEQREEEVEKLSQECEVGFDTLEAIQQCQFYVRAIDYYYETSEMLSEFEWDPETTSSADAYKICGKVTVHLNEYIANGGIGGVQIIENYEMIDEYGEEETVDVFSLDEAPSSHELIAVNSAITIGSMIAYFIGTTVVKVCQDFDVNDFHWLL